MYFKVDGEESTQRNKKIGKSSTDQTTEISHSERKKTGVHRILGGIFEELLTPLDITVNTDLPVMTLPPEADILLLRRKAGPWTKEQLKRIPDGIRRVKTQYVLIEFKYTESLDSRAVKQADQYEALYVRSQKLKPNQISTFLISSKTPRMKTLNRLEYAPTEINGVYQGASVYNRNVTLIVSNELDDTPYNAVLKLFSSKKRQATQAYKRFVETGFQNLSERLRSLITGSRRIFFKYGGNMIEFGEVTLEEVEKVGREYILDGLSILSTDEVVKKLGKDEVINSIGKDEVINSIGKENLLESFSTDELKEALKKKDRKN